MIEDEDLGVVLGEERGDSSFRREDGVVFSKFEAFDREGYLYSIVKFD